MSTFFQNRSKWRKLYQASDDIIKMSQIYREQHPSIRESKSNVTNKYSYQFKNEDSQANVNETSDLRVNIIFN